MKFSYAEGSYLYAGNGTRMINLSESNNILGHRNPGIIRAIRSHISELPVHYPLTVSFPDVAGEVLERLSVISGLGSSTGVFSSSGSEACDVALTVLSESGPVITLQNAYHGKSGQFVHKREVDLLRYGRAFEIPFPDGEHIMDSISECVNAGASSIIVEALQVESGLHPLYPEFFRDLSMEFPDLLVCVDESYTGMGKTGRAFSYQMFGKAEPDVVIVGKAIGGGIPLGVTLFRNSTGGGSVFMNSLRNNVYGSTSGNLLALTLAGLIIDHVSNGVFLSEVRRKGDMIGKELGEAFGDRIRGYGLIRGLGFAEGGEAQKFSAGLAERGVFATAMGDAIRISPPLTIEDSVLGEAMGKIKEGI